MWRPPPACRAGGWWKDGGRGTVYWRRGRRACAENRAWLTGACVANGQNMEVKRPADVTGSFVYVPQIFYQTLHGKTAFMYHLPQLLTTGVTGSFYSFCLLLLLGLSG